MSKLVAVFGATGRQGGAVVRDLLREPSKWKVVALTRDATGEKAMQLQTLGAEVRTCDVNKLAEVESALKVMGGRGEGGRRVGKERNRGKQDKSEPCMHELTFLIKGVYGVFGLTDFWAARTRDVEVQQGKNIVDAAKKVGVQHLVFRYAVKECSKRVKGALVR
jgi:uncharacterized protein YbjT (DUF2867 family)